MTAERPVVSVDTRLAETAGLNTAEIRRVAARETEGGLLVRDTIPALCDAVDGLRAAHDELLSQLRDARAENARLRGDVRRQTERADAVELIESRGRGLAQERAARAEAALATVRELVLQWDDLLQAQVAVMTTAQANARRDALCALSYALPAAEQDEPALPESMLTGPATFEFDEQEEDEPKRCEHGWTKAHTWCPHNRWEGTCREWRACPGPVSSPPTEGAEQ